MRFQTPPFGGREYSCIIPRMSGVRQFFEKYIDGTPEKAPVPSAMLRVCNLTNVVSQELGLPEGTHAAHLTTRALKHLYDKKPAEEFSCIIDGLEQVTRYPSRIYANKQGKRAGFCLVGEFNGIEYICALEIKEMVIAEEVELFTADGIEIDEGVSAITVQVCIATAFRVRDDKYLSKCTLLWSREDGNPHRSALDASEEVY